MNAAIISLGSVSSKLTFEAMKKYFDEVDFINLKNVEVNLGHTKKENRESVLVDGEPIKKYDCIYAKGSFRYNTILRAITTALKKDTYFPLVGSAYTIGHDKLLTHIKLQEIGIPMPGTYLSSSTIAAKSLLERINYPIIMKLPQGTQGKGVLFAESFPAASSILDTLTSLKQPFIIQEYIETDSTDLRAFVIGDKVVGAMKRRAVKGEKRSNIHAGGHGEKAILDSKTKKIAVSAAKALGCGICGVDILESVKGPVVIELNLSPGLQGLMTATNDDIPDKIGKYLYEQTTTFKGGKEDVSAKQILDDIGVEKIGNEIISTLDFRGERILLPKIVTQISKIQEGTEYVISLEKNSVKIKKM
jgi:ribosomal protein S6--L-glutamate ligase